MKWLFVILITSLGIVIMRTWLARKIWSPQSAEAFKGTVMRLGENLVAIPDRSHLPAEHMTRATLVCFPGFLEDMRYFMEVYHDMPVRLVILGNANYHNPFDAAVTDAPVWYGDNPYEAGTIAYDAWSLNRVLQHMTDSERVVVHGHSRGGAVILEAGQQNPDIAKGVEAILEAPVVPRGRLAGRNERQLDPVGFYLYPFVLTLLRFLPRRILKSPMMWVTNPTKDHLVASIPFAPRQYVTAIRNTRDIIDWQSHADYCCYDNFQRITLYVGERDGVLWRKAMLDSATQSKSVVVVETQGTDHFISLESPEVIRAYFNEA